MIPGMMYEVGNTPPGTFDATLQGRMWCPLCGESDRIDIEASIWVRVIGNTVDAQKSGVGFAPKWDLEFAAHCDHCGHIARVADFQRPRKTGKAAGVAA
jgi:hypothetical protein